MKINNFLVKVKHSIRDLSRGQYQVLYYPQLATTHKVDIKYNGLSVPDSPVVLNAKNPGNHHYFLYIKLAIFFR